MFSHIWLIFFLTSFFSFSVHSEGRVELLGGGSIQIFNLTEEDAGIYTCMADNANATIEAQAQLTIQGTISIVCLLAQNRNRRTEQNK